MKDIKIFFLKLKKRISISDSSNEIYNNCFMQIKNKKI